MFTCSAAGCVGGGARAEAAGGETKSGRGRSARNDDSIVPRSRAAIARDRRGRARRIDIHCHYHVVELDPLVAHLDPLSHTPAHIYATPLTREVNARQMKDRLPMLTSIERRLADMDRMGIDVQAVSPSPSQYYYWADAGLCAETSRKANDRIAEIVGKWPERFVGLGTVPLQDTGLAIAELERCIRGLGFRGVEINSNVNGRNLTDPALGLEKFFARVEELGAVIFIHPWAFTHGERLREHYFANVIGMPLESTIAAGQLIFDGVMARHPRLKVVLAHGGGYIAHYHARMDHVYRARPDGHTVLRRKPSSYLAKFHFDTITFDPGMLRNLVDAWGASQVLLGTDYPYDMMDVDPVGTIEAVPRLTRAQKDAIMGGNAARLLGLRQPKAAARRTRKP